jgi:hypothetical protein
MRGLPSAASALSLGRVPIPLICPLISRFSSFPRSASKTWNFTLEEPALTTRIVSIAGHAAGNVAAPRRAWA